MTLTQTTVPRLRRRIALGLAGAMTALPALALVPDFDAPATPGGERRAGLASYAVPTGPWQGGVIPSVTAEGVIDQRAWKLDAPGKSTLELLQPLRDQAEQAGFGIVFECEARTCGGFDFRYGTDILPEPEMHVDLGDYRFLAARRDGGHGTDWITLIVSRSSDTGFVQVTAIGAQPTGAPDLSVSTKSSFDPSAVTLAQDADRPASDGLSLVAGKPVVLKGLAFASGKAVLDGDDQPALRDLAGWLADNPAARVELVGHTDASGNAADNTALSQARADATRAALVALGVAADRITTRGAGPAEPVAGNDTPEGRAQNRRVEAILTPTP